jgi:hypothetical protein
MIIVTGKGSVDEDMIVAAGAVALLQKPCRIPAMQAQGHACLPAWSECSVPACGRE